MLELHITIKLAKFFECKSTELDLLHKRDLLDIYVGTDEYIIKEEDLSLLRL